MNPLAGIAGFASGAGNALTNKKDDKTSAPDFLGKIHNMINPAAASGMDAGTADAGMADAAGGAGGTAALDAAPAAVASDEGLKKNMSTTDNFHAILKQWYGRKHG